MVKCPGLVTTGVKLMIFSYRGVTEYFSFLMIFFPKLNIKINCVRNVVSGSVK